MFVKISKSCTQVIGILGGSTFAQGLKKNKKGDTLPTLDNGGVAVGQNFIVSDGQP